ncbi:MAG: N-acetylmuramoyl-L-alanine amidase [Alphaproteobacteria bacterium]|nr:N-acetylmuramoyl-L-alanine amidase [Alphaproteobacteria bacterium]
MTPGASDICHRTERRIGYFTALAAVFVALLSAVLGPNPAAAAGPEVKDLRIGIRENETRFVIDLNQKVEPRIFGLPDPYRIVIDLPEVDFTLPAERLGAQGGLVERLRYGLFRPGTSRLVLDLRSAAKVAKTFVLPPDGAKPWRLVIDIVPTDRAGFMAAMRPTPPVTGRTATPSPPLRTEPVRRAVPVVAIDPGHGGVDPGAIGKSGVYEKDIVLAFAKEIKRQLEAGGRVKAVLTRNRDIFLPLRDRVQAARRANADLFLSLHVNSHKIASIHGFSAYTLSDKASDAEADALAAKENKADVIGGLNLSTYSDDVQNILIDFAQAKTNELSVRFARDIMVREVSQIARMVKRPWRSAGFAVLKAPDVPSVLIEMGYVTNRQEERQLRDSKYRRALSGAIARSIVQYLETNDSAAVR